MKKHSHLLVSCFCLRCGWWTQQLCEMRGMGLQIIRVFFFLCAFQDMKTAVITPCSHFFHAGCLKKWLYVQETCPLCHCQLKSPSQLPGLGPEPAQQPNPSAEQNTRPGDAAEPPAVEHDNGPSVKGSSGEGDGQVGEGQDSPKASAGTEGSQSTDSDTSPCGASQGAACAAEPIAAPEGCPARDPSICVQL